MMTLHTNVWPEEESQWPHVTQVHPKNAAQLLQGQHLLLLLPPHTLRLAAALGQSVAIQAGGRAGGVGHGLLAQLSSKTTTVKKNILMGFMCC